MYDLDAMKTLGRLTALIVCALLLSVPVAAGCGGPGTMSADCPMIGMQSMAEMVGSPCHESAPIPDDCCDIEPAPEPIQAPSFEQVKLIIALDVAELPAAGAVAPPIRLAARESLDRLPEHDVGRYTLFSSLLL